MERISTTARPDWLQKVEAEGMFYHSDENGQLLWDERAFYRFTSDEIDAIERATYRINELCLEAVPQILADEAMLERFLIPPAYRDFLRRSWDRDEHTLYGRMDLAMVNGTPKLLEYNADTPTILLESSVIQWSWLQETQDRDRYDQYNSIHDKLIEFFQTTGKWSVTKPCTSALLQTT